MPLTLKDLGPELEETYLQEAIVEADVENVAAQTVANHHSGDLEL